MGDELSLRDELIQAAGMQTDQQIPPEAPEKPAEAEAQKPEAEDKPSGERERGPDGKFVKKADDKQPELELESKDQPKDEQQEPAEPAIKLPKSWSAEYKAEFLTLPPKVQEYILKREAETDSLIGKKGQEAGHAAKQLTEFNSVLDPYRSKIAMRGVSESQHIANLLKAEEQLETNPYQAFQYLARSYGVDLSRFAQQQNQAAPQVAAELQPLYGQVQQLTNYVTQQQQNMTAQQQAAAMSEINAFAANAEHFNDVMDDMMPLVAQIKQANPAIAHRDALQQAYDKAVWANPHTRALEIAKQNATAEATRKAEAAKVAKEAQRKNVSLSGAPSGMPTTPSNGSLRDDLERAFKSARA